MPLSRALGAATGLVLALLIAGCGGSDPDEPSVGGTQGASATATADEASLPDGVPTEPPARPDDAKTPAGATAFGEYVLEVWWYTFLSHDTAAMDELAPADESCAACVSVIEDATERSDDGLVQRPAAELGLRNGRAVKDGPKEFTARWDVRTPDTVMLRRDSGKVVREVSSPPDWLGVFITMRWAEDHWELLDYRWDV